MSAESKAKLKTEKKEKAIEYYKLNAHVVESVDKVFNLMFDDEPSDIYGYLASFFGKLADTHRISKIVVDEIRNESWKRSISINIYCLINCSEKHMIKRNFLTMEECENVLSTLSCIDQFITTELIGMDPLDQPSIDATIRCAFDSYQKMEKDTELRILSMILQADDQEKQKEGKSAALSSISHHCKVPELFAVPLVSQTACALASVIYEVPLFRHIREIAETEESCYMPLPVMAVLHGGDKRTKVRLLLLDEIFLIPSSSLTFEESMETQLKIHKQLSSLLGGGKRPASRGPLGGLIPAVDKLDQAIDAVVTAIKQSGFEPGNDMFLGLALHGDETFDQKQQKYSISSNLKRPKESMYVFYVELLNKHPYVKLLVNPFCTEDEENWQKLRESLGSECGLASRKIPFNASCHTAAFIKFKSSYSVTDVMKEAKLLHESACIVILEATGNTITDFAADFAIGVGASMVYLPGPSSAMITDIVNQLIHIERRLTDTYNVCPASKAKSLQMFHQLPKITADNVVIQKDKEDHGSAQALGDFDAGISHENVHDNAEDTGKENDLKGPAEDSEDIPSDSANIQKHSNENTDVQDVAVSGLENKTPEENGDIQNTCLNQSYTKENIPVIIED